MLVNLQLHLWVIQKVRHSAEWRIKQKGDKDGNGRNSFKKVIPPFQVFILFISSKTQLLLSHIYWGSDNIRLSSFQGRMYFCIIF